MLRFSLGSHRQHQHQHQKDTRRRPFSRIKKWWHRLHDKLATPAPDFGDLSPDRPPLPFIGSFTDAADQARGVTSRPAEDITLPWGKEGSLLASTSRPQAPGDRNGRQGNLYTIHEEIETVKSESSMPRQISTLEEESKLKRLSSESHGSEEGSDPSSSTTSSSISSYHPPPLWPSRPQKNEPTFDLTLVGNEDACRRIFAKMITSAYAFHNEYKGPVPRDAQVVFDGKDNVKFIRFVVKGRTEQHKFTGNSQFIPPELAVSQGLYNSKLADVWILGINLYRMLTGKFPFAGSNDRAIFKKMLHAEFSIPQGYSEDLKDLLLRMLAPDTTRASLDLILYHEWLKPCKVTVPTPPPPIPPLPSTGAPTPDKRLSRDVASSPPTPQRPSSQDRPKQPRFARALEHMAVLLVKGPYPPPRRPYRELGQPIRF